MSICKVCMKQVPMYHNNDICEECANAVQVDDEIDNFIATLTVHARKQLNKALQAANKRGWYFYVVPNRRNYYAGYRNIVLAEQEGGPRFVVTESVDKDNWKQLLHKIMRIDNIANGLQPTSEALYGDAKPAYELPDRIVGYSAEPTNRSTPITGTTPSSCGSENVIPAITESMHRGNFGVSVSDYVYLVKTVTEGD